MSFTEESRFFKYMSFEVCKTVLQNRTLRWSTPGTLNDPYDIQFDLHIGVDREEVKRRALRKLWEAHYGNGDVPVGNITGQIIRNFGATFPRLSLEDFNREYGEALDESFVAAERIFPEVQENVRRYMANTKILCLTKSPNNNLMWSHYADHHRGSVLRFRMVDGLDSPWTQAKPIQYLANMPGLFDEESLSDLLSGRAELDHRTAIDRILYTKSSEWSYEEEWRICAGTGRTPGSTFEDIPFGHLELDAVIFGCRMPEKNRNEIIGLVKMLYPHAEVLEIVKSQHEFRFEVKSHQRF